MIALESIRAAAARLTGAIHRTPILRSTQLGRMADVEFFFKCESFQKTGSFKPRGALNTVRCLPPAELAKGLVTVSAGNHAQAVAWAARIAGVPAAVVMPSDAPRSKIEAVRGYGAEVILHDDRATLFDRLEAVRAERGSTFIHPFDDARTLAGAGTIGLEILEDVPDLEAVVVPVGGGGLLAGIASAVKQIRPRVKVIAVELEAGPGLGPALSAGRPVPVPRPKGTLADGMTPPFVGELPLAIAREAVDEIVLVSEAAIARAMTLIMTRAKLYVEGSGAAATAALLEAAPHLRPGARVVSLLSGANVDLDRIPSARQQGPS